MDRNHHPTGYNQVIRRAGLVDVPAVARLFKPTAPPALDAELNTERDPERVAAMFRLLLAHHALEEGTAWVSASHPAHLTGAAVWLPPGVHHETSAFKSVIERELEIPPEDLAKGRTDSEVLRASWADRRQWTVLVSGSRAHGSMELADLLAPGIQDVDQEGESVAALSMTEGDRDSLAPLRADASREILLPSGTRLWLTPLNKFTVLTAA